MTSAIITLTPFPRAHLGYLGGHDLNNADASDPGVIGIENLLLSSLILSISPLPPFFGVRTYIENRRTNVFAKAGSPQQYFTVWAYHFTCVSTFWNGDVMNPLRQPEVS